MDFPVNVSGGARTPTMWNTHDPIRPTEGVQPDIVEHVDAPILRLSRDLRLTILVVERNLAFARRSAHGFSMIDNGRAVTEGLSHGPTDQLVARRMTI
jgi:urea transport system ATP-binding protein